VGKVREKNLYEEKNEWKKKSESTELTHQI
jgi:hypothetical protein